ncbi:MAG: PQQ-dependent sugar dehydrogenase [Pseudomonadota bacterium]
MATRSPRKQRWLRTALKTLLVLVVLLLAVLGVAYWYFSTADAREPSRVAFAEHCAACHGTELAGTERGPSLMRPLDDPRGEMARIAEQIIDLHPEQDLDAWRASISSESIKAIALYVSERRQQWPATGTSKQLAFSESLVESRHHRFRIERVAALAGKPYSLEPLPDGRVLVAEKSRGLSLVEPNGQQRSPISGTPPAFDPLLNLGGNVLHLGSLLDVQRHPEFHQNGWIYLSHSHRCEANCGTPWPKSMVRVVRGRIRENQWVDEEIIWSVDPGYYTVVPDAVACGRLAFDDAGHVYVTVGGKAPYKHLHDLDTPYGKIHRVRDDGRVPEDNPFYLPANQRDDGSTQHTVYSYGHRTVQGLTAHPQNGTIWSTEMGPRGGDEINRIMNGQNYGWPLYTEGLGYNGKPITIGTDLGLTFPRAATIAPVVDFSPAPAISNLTVYEGEAFPAWNGDFLVGSLKARTLYRVRVRNEVAIEVEKLATNVGRIRDVEVGSDGTVYIAVEQGESGLLLRMVPEAHSD